MTQALGSTAPDPAPRRMGLDPYSRVAMIVEHANQLAEEVTGTHSPSSSPSVSVRRVIAARAARRRHFDADLFADPAWDILLELYALRCEQTRISVSKLCVGIGVPMTTGLRWMERLTKDGLITREADPFDARRVWVALSDDGFEAMTNYLRELGRTPMPL